LDGSGQVEFHELVEAVTGLVQDKLVYNVAKSGNSFNRARDDDFITSGAPDAAGMPSRNAYTLTLDVINKARQTDPNSCLAKKPRVVSEKPRTTLDDGCSRAQALFLPPPASAVQPNPGQLRQFRPPGGPAAPLPGSSIQALHTPRDELYTTRGSAAESQSSWGGSSFLVKQGRETVSSVLYGRNSVRASPRVPANSSARELDPWKSGSLQLSAGRSGRVRPRPRTVGRESGAQMARPDSQWAHEGLRPTEQYGWPHRKPGTPSKAVQLKGTLDFISIPYQDRISEWQNMSTEDKGTFCSKNPLNDIKLN